MINYAVTTAPAEEPLTLVEVKNHLKVDFSTDDDWINRAIQAAREVAENQTATGLISQSITEKFNGFPIVTANNQRAEILLYKSPLRSVTSLTYTDEDGQSQTLTEDTDFIAYTNAKPPRLALVSGKSWPTTLTQAQSVIVVYTVGAADAAAVPARIKQGMMLLIAQWYEKRQNDPQSPFSVKPGVAEFLFDMETVY